MRLAFAVLTLSLAACADEPDPREKAAADAAAVAEVKANQEAPPENLVPEAIVYADIEKAGLFGAGCNFVAAGAGTDAIVLAQADMGYMKRSDEIVAFAPDKGSANNPVGSWRKYDGKDNSLVLEINQQNGRQSGMETVDFAAELTVRDGKDRVVYHADGTAQCGA
ncbi:hypothetical protein [Qipengyuania marisflavi]|uniref:Lipoprotein n=1 Tax=Qipengyuania marisflavi TaxID=2486356 RepID=A0A5S3P8T4_9SPHN|nr:hypothetical protein [Qipengyuania marisflavi]TMM49848.1 hypothetical protein FEV51_01210 [Qipengyuania marisflavi]